MSFVVGLDVRLPVKLVLRDEALDQSGHNNPQDERLHVSHEVSPERATVCEVC